MREVSKSPRCTTGARSLITCAVTAALAPYSRSGNTASYAGNPLWKLPLPFFTDAAIFAAAGDFVLGHCHAPAGVHRRRLRNISRPFNAVRAHALCRCGRCKPGVASCLYLSCRGGLLSLLVNRLATDCSASKPYRLLHCCSYAARRACHEQATSRIISMQSELHKQRFFSRLANGSE